MTGQEKGDLNRGDHMDRFDYCQVRKWFFCSQCYRLYYTSV